MRLEFGKVVGLMAKAGSRARIWLASLAATGAMGASMLLCRWLFGAVLPPEMLYNWSARLLGVPWVFNLIHSLPGGLDFYAKYVLFVVSVGLYLCGWLIFGLAYPALRRGSGPWVAGAVCMAVAVLSTGLVLLPLQGLGVFGLSPANFSYSPLAAALWSALFGLVFAVCWEFARGRPAPQVDPGRRESLHSLAGGALAAFGLAAFGRVLVAGAAWAQGAAQALVAKIKGVAAEITPVQEHYVVSKNIFDPSVDKDRWSLTVRGLVNKEITLSMDDLLAMPKVERASTLTCVSNPVGGDLIGNSVWTGVHLNEILKLAGPKPEASEIILRAADNYTDSFPLAAGLPESVIVAYLQNGEPLTRQHGFPARVLIPGIYGMKNVKWVVELELAARDYQGFWQTRGWSDTAVVETMSRIDTPSATKIAEGGWAIGGVAFAGLRGVSKVEVSVDGGESWQGAELKPALNDLSWNLWGFRWDPEPGRYEVLVRATDGTGATQTAKQAPPLPDGATGYHRLRVRVG